MAERLPKNLVEAICYFSDAERACDFVVKMRWPDGRVTCPRCGHGETSFLSTRRIWKCKAEDCRRQFSLKVGTIFEDSPLGWDKWLPAIWLIAKSKNSMSSHALARSLPRGDPEVGVVHAPPDSGCDGDRHVRENVGDYRT
jgi:transposase-like protein